VSAVRVAALQLAAHNRTDFSATWPAIVARIRDAAQLGASLIVLPEGTLPAYVLADADFSTSEIAGQIEQLQELCQALSTVVVAGAARRGPDGTFNSALVIDSDGSLAGTYDKHFLWDFDRLWFAPGTSIEPIATSLGPLGVMICADGRIPTIARWLVDRGAVALVMPTAWVTSGRDPEHLENVQADLMARVRARENGVPFIAANKVGTELDCVAYCGKSQVVRSDGSIAALASQAQPQTIVADLDLRPPARPRTAIANIVAVPAPHPSVRIALSAIPQASWSNAQERAIAADAWIDRTTMSANLRDRAVRIGDAEMQDPGYLPECRLAGYDLAIWDTTLEPPWQSLFAGCRALELRMYVVVADEREETLHAIDPDGAVVCGTFGTYKIARFTLMPERIANTFVASGTDILEGLRRARAASVS